MYMLSAEDVRLDTNNLTKSDIRSIWNIQLEIIVICNFKIASIKIF